MNIHLKLLILFGSLIALGWVATFALYKFKLRRKLSSSIKTKISMWVPIAIIFVFTYSQTSSFRFYFLLFLVLMMVIEFYRFAFRRGEKLWTWIFLVFSIFGILHLALLKSFIEYDALLLTIIVANAMSDVFAFFTGKIFGKYKLPSFINSKKSWDGVIGQFLGALIGVMLVRILFYPSIALVFFVPIGLGNSLGDIFNSKVKRDLSIQSWGNSIPGHGGFLDRFSSLSGSAIFFYYFLYAFV
jgi:phosphatidate cytidylyltransferase